MMRIDAKAQQRGVDLADATVGDRSLDGGERLQILDTWIDVLGGAYAHLPAKRAAYAVDPVQALVQLRRRASDLSDAAFHLALCGVVTGLRDAHTRYQSPRSVNGEVATLPFLVEACGPYNAPAFLVSKVAKDLVDDKQFEPGVRLLRFNSVPFERALDVYADRETGGRPDARRARALESFTFRSLAYGPPPDELDVLIDYRTRKGKERQVRMPWRVVVPLKARTAAKSGSRASRRLATNPAAEAVRRGKKLLFSLDAWVADVEATPSAPNTTAKGASAWLPTKYQDNLAARTMKVGRKSFGYLRVWSFDVEDHGEFVTEVVSLLQALPQNGVIVDLRGNPGGLVWAAERMLQLFTRMPISPTRFSLVASPLTRAMAQNPFNRMELEAWAPSLDDAVSTGELWSRPLPLTDPNWCNDEKWAYPGKAVAVVDANTYSSGDLFAAGWVDHGIGDLVTVGAATGGGGANVWTDAQLRDALTTTEHAFDRLPGDAGFTLSIRRAIRSGTSDGIPIEDLGIGGIPYDMTERDLLEGNVDLVAFCANLLED